MSNPLKLTDQGPELIALSELRLDPSISAFVPDTRGFELIGPWRYRIRGWARIAGELDAVPVVRQGDVAPVNESERDVLMPFVGDVRGDGFWWIDTPEVTRHVQRQNLLVGLAAFDERNPA